MDAPEETGNGVKQQKAVTIDARRMRHGETGGDDVVAANVHDDAAVATPVTPAVGHIAGTDRGDVANPAVVQSHAIKMTAIFRSQLAHKRRPPQRREAIALVHGGQAAEA